MAAHCDSASDGACKRHTAPEAYDLLNTQPNGAMPRQYTGGLTNVTCRRDVFELPVFTAWQGLH